MMRRGMLFFSPDILDILIQKSLLSTEIVNQNYRIYAAYLEMSSRNVSYSSAVLTI